MSKFKAFLLAGLITLGLGAQAADPCNCIGYAGVGGPCYAGVGGPAYAGVGALAYFADTCLLLVLFAWSWKQRRSAILVGNVK